MHIQSVIFTAADGCDVSNFFNDRAKFTQGFVIKNK